MEVAGAETGRAVSESQKGEVPAAADGGALSQGAQSVPQAPGLEELFRSLLMGAQAAPEGDASLQQVPQTAVPGMAQASGCGRKKGPYCLQPGSRPPEGSSSRYRRSRRLRVMRSPRVQTEVFLPRRMVVQPRPRLVTPAARESGAQTPADAGETAGRPAGGEQELPSWTVCRRRGRRSRSLTGQSTSR